MRREGRGGTVAASMTRSHRGRHAPNTAYWYAVRAPSRGAYLRIAPGRERAANNQQQPSAGAAGAPHPPFPFTATWPTGVPRRKTGNDCQSLTASLSPVTYNATSQSTRSVSTNCANLVLIQDDEIHAINRPTRRKSPWRKSCLRR
jgi:hypothetical protein